MIAQRAGVEQRGVDAKDRVQVDAEHHVPLLIAHARQGLVARHASVVHDDVHAAVGLSQRFDQARRCVRGHHVQGQRAATDLTCGLAQGAVVVGTIDTHHVRTFGRQQRCRRRTDATRRASHNRDLAGEWSCPRVVVVRRRQRADAQRLSRHKRRSRAEEETNRCCGARVGALFDQQQVARRALAAELLGHGTIEAVESRARRRLRHAGGGIRGATQDQHTTAAADGTNVSVKDLVEALQLRGLTHAGRVDHHCVQARVIAERRERSTIGIARRLKGRLRGVVEQRSGCTRARQGVSQHAAQSALAADEDSLAL